MRDRRHDVYQGAKGGLIKSWTLVAKHPKIAKANHATHLGTLGTGNHFIEVCLDQSDHVWVMLHSGSRGIGNRIDTYFIGLAKEEMRRWFVNLPDDDLAYLPEGSQHFDDYVEAVGWAQEYARLNRALMMQATLRALRAVLGPKGAVRAGRAMSRSEARRRFTVEDHARMTEGVECRKDAAVIDETPAAYKDIDAVMAAQAELVDIVHTLRQVVCVKG